MAHMASWKTHHLKMYSPLKMGDFAACHVSFQWCIGVPPEGLLQNHVSSDHQNPGYFVYSMLGGLYCPVIQGL